MSGIVLVPLDERPVCTSLPAGIARIAGLDCALPPSGLLPRIRRPGDTAGLTDWLSAARQTASFAIVSLEGLGFGGLIPSRIGHESQAEVAVRWSVLRQTGCPVFASTLVPRTPDSSDPMEEPDYWDPHGPALHSLSAARAKRAGVAQAQAAVPREVRLDWIGRRLRQHALALQAVELAADNTVGRLVIGIDDAAEESLSAADQRALGDWVDRCELGDRVFVQPGADEIGAVLVARACLAVRGVRAPIIGIMCSDPEALNRVAPYESSRVRETIRRQIEAAGAHAVFLGSGIGDSSSGSVSGIDSRAAGCDVILVVHPPEEPRVPAADWAVAPDHHLDPHQAALTADLVTRALTTTTLVGLADVARPNGADPALVAALDAADVWRALGGFAAWNTAGNTVGTVAAQLVAGWAARESGTLDAGAVRLSVARRVVEDYGWMSLERERVRTILGSPRTRHDNIAEPDTGNPVLRDAETRLSAVLAARPGLERVRIEPGSLTLPWQRTFEIDLNLIEAG
ncbi:MAG: DUF4127 family protein [Cryobacterium sp.]|uniref:DUF4127 family protein n=1 Tax=Cryobacterium sp. TaxID=1926290 RepID=UPI00228BEFF1|nr:DUF4127 family protein [Cryobacterium sp.]MCY7403129.1 DUF4127 family protein [Cryobacterium sp.]